jgi:hypothetical protein
MDNLGQWLPWIGAAASMVCLACALRARKQRLLIDYLPTSKTSSVYVGHVELKGTAESRDPLKSQFTSTPCVWFRITVQERNQHSTKDEDWDTRTVTQEVPFELKDDHGSLRIDPRGAKVMPEVVYGKADLQLFAGPQSPVRSSIPANLRLVREEVIRLHSRIFVVGHASQRPGGATAEIAWHADEAMFVISTRSEEALSRRLGMLFWTMGLAGLCLALLAIEVREHVLNNRHAGPMGFARAGFAYGLLWFSGWLAMMYNSLIDLRQRVRKAWAAIDVELKRRADLLPELVNILQALAGHEHTMQHLIATLRAQAGATAPGVAGPDAAAVSGPLKVVAEAYPQLNAQGLFLNLQKQLALTEDRIALARIFFNGTATFYNTRIGIFPDGLIAGLIGMRAQPLMNEAGFLRPAALMNTPGSDTAGPCPKCARDVRALGPSGFCPFCGSRQPELPTSGAQSASGQCGACGRYQKPESATDTRLAGNVCFCGGCGFKLVK